MREAQIWGNKVNWRPDLTPETAHQEAEKLIAEFKATPHEELAGSQFIDSFELANGGIAVHALETSYSDSMSTIHAFMFTPQNSVFFCAYTVYQSTAEKWRKQLIELAANLHAHDDNAPIPTQPGFCFEGGIIHIMNLFGRKKRYWGLVCRNTRVYILLL